MDTLPDLATFDLFRTAAGAPDLDRIEAALRCPDAITARLAAQSPTNEVFAGYLAGTRRGLALMPEARMARAEDDRDRLEVIATELARLNTARGRGAELADWGSVPPGA